MFVGSGDVAAKTSSCESLPETSGVAGMGGGVGVGVEAGADLQKDRLREGPIPTVTFDRGFRV